MFRISHRAHLLSFPSSCHHFIHSGHILMRSLLFSRKPVRPQSRGTLRVSGTLHLAPQFTHKCSSGLCLWLQSTSAELQKMLCFRSGSSCRCVNVKLRMSGGVSAFQLFPLNSLLSCAFVCVCLCYSWRVICVAHNYRSSHQRGQ